MSPQVRLLQTELGQGQQQWARLTDNENIIDIAMDDASWFNLVPDLNHGQTHVSINLQISSNIYPSPSPSGRPPLRWGH